MTTTIILDAHLDIAWNYLGNGRDFLHSVADKRAREAQSPTQAQDGTTTVSLPDALAGNVGIIFATLYTCPDWARMFANDIVYATPQEAHNQASQQLGYYETLFAHPQIAPVRTLADLHAVQATWQRPPAERTLGVVVLMEGADPIITPADFAAWYGRGVRAVGLAWSETRYSGGTIYHGRGAGGLTPLGRELLVEMAKHNAILDLSHMAEEAYLEAVDRYEGVLIASHSNPRRFRNSDRHLSDDMIKKLVARDGVIGLVPFNNFLNDNPDIAKDRTKTPVRRYVDAIDTVCQLAGNTRHAGIGTDFDGGFGREKIPFEMDSIASLPLIAEELGRRNYPAEAVEAICSGNFLRMLARSLPQA